MKHPLAWVLDESPTSADAIIAEMSEDFSISQYFGYVQCDLNGMHVSHPYMDWGIVIDASPNHKLGFNHFPDLVGTTATMNTTTENFLPYDYDTLVATIAMESNHRIRLAHQLNGTMAAGDGSVKTILDREAELWVMLPNTVVDLTTQPQSIGEGSGPAGQLVTGGSEQRVLRNDIDRLQLVLGGEVARYGTERTKAVFTWKRFQDFGDLIGQCLSVVQQGQVITRVYALITSVEWTLGKSPQTIVKAGYA